MRASRLAPNLSRAGRAAPLLVLGAVALLVVSPRIEARRRDRKPPVFAGLDSATTCIPGPIGAGTTASYHLSWEPAMDKVSPSSAIVYDVYQASASGGEDFSMPTYTTPAGATSFDTPPLPADETFYFVVRATDEAGKTDSHTGEPRGVNPCV